MGKYKNKRFRTSHKCCKTCCFKSGIQCSINYYGYAPDGDGGCENRVDIFWRINEPQYEYRKSTKNWKRLHRKKYLKDLFEQIHNDIEFNEWLETVRHKGEESE
jgi:hypothetical protein